MSEEVQELRTVFSWDTTDAESGAQRMAKAFEKIEGAEKRQVEQSAANQKKATDARKAAGHGGGGHGGHGGGGFGANVGWALHDFAEGRGTNAMFRLASAFGVVGTGAAVATQAINQFSRAYEASARTVEATAALKLAMGEGTTSAAQRNGAVALFQRVTGNRTLFEQEEGGSGTNQSAGGIAQQREAIQAAIRGEQESRTYRAVWWDTMMFHEGTGHVYESLDRETRANDRLQDLDVAAGGIARRRTAAERLGAYGSERAGRLAQSQVQTDEEMAALGDANRAGKMGPGEYAAKVAAAQSQQQIRDRDANLTFDERDRENATNFHLAAVRRGGYHVAVEEARSRMLDAGVALRDAPTDEARKAADGRFLHAQEDYRQAGLSQRSLDARLDSEKRVADFRGGAEARALQASREELAQQEALLAIARERGADAEKAARVGVAAAAKQLDLLERQQAVQRLATASAVRLAPVAVAAAGARLGGADDLAAARIELRAQAVAAADALENARQRVEYERGSEESLRAQAEAARSLAQAQAAIVLHEQQVRRERRYELESAQGRTAALSFSASGRDDLGTLAEQRTESRVAIQRANQAGNPLLARELAGQQRLRETRSVEDLYLDPVTGRPRPAYAQRELFQRRLHQTQVDVFKRQMDANGGLMSVHRDLNGRIESGVDPLTGERLNARQIFERNHAAQARVDSAKDDRSDSEVFKAILDALQKGLPKTTK